MPAISPRFVPAAQPQTLVGFLKSIGGLLDHPELRARDARKVWPGLVNNARGLTFDVAREAAAEAGFLGEPIDRAMAETDVNDFLSALDSHPHYRARDADRLTAWQGSAVSQAFEASVNDTICELRDFCDEHDMPCGDEKLLRIAAKIYLDNALETYDGALEQAAALRKSRPKRAALALVKPTAPDLPRNQAALAWRIALGLSRAGLAAAIGFSASQIQDYEEGARRGKAGPSAAISPAAWRRYGLACAAFSARLGEPF